MKYQQILKIEVHKYLAIYSFFTRRISNLYQPVLPTLDKFKTFKYFRQCAIIISKNNDKVF